MDKFSSLLSERFDASLAHNFQRQASYYAGMDFLEYVSEDTTTIADRVDSFLTVLLDADEHRLVGFRFKGFGHAFSTFIKPVMKLRDDDFNPIVFALERYFTDVGNTMIDQRREEAYKQVLELAERDKVGIPEDFLAAA